MNFSYDLMGYPDRIEIVIYLNVLEKKYLKNSFLIKFDYDLNIIWIVK